MDERLLKPYNPGEVEDRIYKKWEESGFFNPDTCVEKGVIKKDAENAKKPIVRQRIPILFVSLKYANKKIYATAKEETPAKTITK